MSSAAVRVRNKPTGKNNSSNSLVRRLSRQRYLQIMAVPGAIWMIVFCYIPMIGILIAFMDYDVVRPLWQNPWVGLKHFVQFFTDENFGLVMTNTLGISFFKLLICFPIPILFAILLNEMTSLKFKRVVQTVSYLPHFISWVILGGIMMTWFSETGFVTEVLRITGIAPERINFLAEPQYFWGLAVISDLWKELGWSAIIYLAAIAGIDVEMYEAAIVDGANRFKQIRYITLPSMKPTIALLFVLSCSNLMNANFDQIFILKNQLNLEASNVIDIFVYNMGIQLSRFSFSTAIGLFKSVINLGLLLGANYVSRKLTDTSLF